jgi:hypothetical protein
MNRLHLCLASAALAAAACSDDTSEPPPPPWTQVIASSQSETAYAVATDPSGNVVLAGSTQGSLGGAASAGGADLFVAKLDPTGATLWIRQLGTSVLDEAYAVATDAAGNVLVAGVTNGGLDGNASLGSQDAVLLKFDPTGTKLWSRQFGTADPDYALGVASDADGNAFVAGVRRGALGQSGDDGFLAKLDANGAPLWTVQIRTPSEDWARAVATDGAGNAFVCGYTTGSLDGNPAAGGHDLFVASYDGSGAHRWTVQLGTNTSDLGYAVATDTFGSVFAGGYTYGAFDGNPVVGGSDVFLVKVDSAGTPQWSAHLGNSGADYAQGVATDADGAVYVGGYTFGSLDGNAHAGGQDAFVAKFDGAGAKAWTRQLGTPGLDEAWGVATDAAGHVFVAGQTAGGLDGIPPAGGWDAFVTSYDAYGNKR